LPSSWPVLALWPLAPAARFLSAAATRALIPTPPSGSRPCAPSSARTSTLSSPSLPSGALRSTGERPLFPSRQLFIGSSTTAWNIGWRAARVQIHHITVRARASRHHTPSSLPPSLEGRWEQGAETGQKDELSHTAPTQHPHASSGSYCPLSSQAPHLSKCGAARARGAACRRETESAPWACAALPCEAIGQGPDIS